MACPDGQYFCNDKQKCMPIPKGHKVREDGELVKESSLNRIRQKSKKGGMAILSAARGNMSKKQKAKADTQLGKDIKGAGLPGSTKVKGKYGKESEPSRVVTSGKMGKRKFKKKVDKLGAKHKQDSVLVQTKGDGKAKLRGTTKGAWPGKGKKVTAGKMKPGRSGEHGHTEVKGKKFTYEATTLPRRNGQTMYVTFTWRGKYMNLQMFFPSLNKPSKAEIQDELVKVYPGAQCKYYYSSDRDPTEPLLQVGEAVDALDRRAQMIARRQYILDRQKMVLRRKELNQNRQGDQEVADDKKKDLTKKLMNRSKEKEGQVTRAESLIRHMRR